MKTVLSVEQLVRAVELVEDFLETEGLEFWRTIVKGDDYKPIRWVSRDSLQRLVVEKKETMMNGPEEAAMEKHFTPPTLTAALRSNLGMEATCDAEVQAIEDELVTIKSTVKEWLRTVGLPCRMGVESIRHLLITLVEEPQ